MRTLAVGLVTSHLRFRGNQIVREAMHSVFLYHAIRHGMDMGIYESTMLAVYDEIPKELLVRVEYVLLNRRDDATERLLEFAESVKGSAQRTRQQAAAGYGRRTHYPFPRQEVIDFIDPGYRRGPA